MPKGLVPIAPLRRGLFVLGGDGKGEKVKRWERWKGEKMGKVKRWKDGRVETWKIERVLDNEQFGLNTNGA